MSIPSRNVWHPLGRKPAAGAPPAEPLDHDERADIDQEDAELTDADEEDAELSDADFYQSLRRDISGVRAGIVPSIHDTEHKVRQMRPWSKKRHPRDRYGNRLD